MPRAAAKPPRKGKKMKKEQIYKGSHVIKSDGIWMEVTGFNGSIVYLDEYWENESGETRYAGETRLTLAEIAGIMKEMDGHNHDLEYVYRYVVEFTDPNSGATSPIDKFTLDQELVYEWEKKELEESYIEEFGDGEIAFVEVDN